MSNNKQNDLRLPRGTRDILGEECELRNNIISKIKNTFQAYGAVELETPMFEQTELLTSKYGEEGSKLIFNIENIGGDNLSLRYDLTVPLSRYIAMNSVEKLKRFQIGKVFRRDNPSVKQGRFREFLQCDFDIIGNSFDSTLAELEVLMVCYNQLTNLEIDNFKIHINSRNFLNALIYWAYLTPYFNLKESTNIGSLSIDKSTLDSEVLNIESLSINSICSSIDKLDKVSFKDIKEELLLKGLNNEQINKLEHLLYSQKNKENELFQIETLLNDLNLINNELSKFSTYSSINNKLNVTIARATKELNNFKSLYISFKELNIQKYFKFELTLARGLDYYTGLILEAKIKDKSSVGSIAGGGRYDGLIGALKGKQTNAVGFSIGIERLFVILKEKLRKQKVNKKVFIIGIGNVNVLEKLKIKLELVNNGFCADCLLETENKMGKQMNVAVKGFGICVIIGENEIRGNTVKIKYLKEKKEIEIERKEMVKTLNEYVSK